MGNHIVPEFLGSHNYENWSACMKNYLLANDLWDIIESTAEPPSPEENEGHEFKTWRKKNAAAIHAIQISCFWDDTFCNSNIRDMTSAKHCWDTVATMYESKVPLIEGESHLQVVNEGVVEDVACLRSLREAIEKGDLDAVKGFIHGNRDLVRKKIADFGKTALHVATLSGNIKIVEVLVENMLEEDLNLVDDNGETALIYAAVAGSTTIAELMVKKNNNLVTHTIPEGDLPVTVACSHGHRETGQYLYSLTPFDLLRPENGAYGSLLLHTTISRRMFDISLDLLERCPSIATRVNKTGINPLHEFSSSSDLFPSGSRFVFWKKWIYSRIHVELPATLSHDARISISQNNHMQQGNILKQGLSHIRSFISNFLEFFGLKQIYDKKLTHAYALKILYLMAQHVSNIDDKELDENGVYEVYFNAIRRGVIEIVVALIKANSTLLTVVDKNLRGLLMLAVANRQEKIFSLVYVLDRCKFLLIYGSDIDKNNMVHIAAMLAPSSRLARISGAALQMQRELQWFKEVESITTNEYRNNSGKTPGELFYLEHKELIAEGEKWMKETATSCSVVGALIITIMFTAAFTVPGGNNQESGYPIFLHKKSFMIFIISDAISLFASSTSVLMFLGVLTSRYAAEDFLKSLPTKLIIGLSTLFISIAAMMVAFCATIIIMLRGELNLIMPLVLLAGVPVTLFVLQQFPLLVEIFASTYGPGIFDRKLFEYWY